MKQYLDAQEHEYSINGATYIVGSVFKEEKETGLTMKESIARLMTSDFTHLDITDKNDKMAVGNVCPTAGKEEYFAVEKDTA